MAPTSTVPANKTEIAKTAINTEAQVKPLPVGKRDSAIKIVPDPQDDVFHTSTSSQVEKALAAQVKGSYNLPQPYFPSANYFEGEIEPLELPGPIVPLQRPMAKGEAPPLLPSPSWTARDQAVILSAAPPPALRSTPPPPTPRLAKRTLHPVESPCTPFYPPGLVIPPPRTREQDMYRLERHAREFEAIRGMDF